MRKHIVHIDKYTDLFLSNVLIFLKTKNFYASHPRNLPLRNEGVFFRQPKHRLRRLLSAQRIPFEFGHTSDFSEKWKIIFLTPLKSSFESIEGLFQSGKLVGLLLPAKSLIHFSKNSAMSLFKTMIFSICANFFGTLPLLDGKRSRRQWH